MISLRTALELRRAGLDWDPADGDRFVLPDRDMDEDVFLVSDMVVEVRKGPAGGFVAFNGTTEWALDAVLQREVVWLPREAQLRSLLADAFVRLERTADGYRCVTTRTGIDGAPVAADPAEAYAAALLEHLRDESSTA